MKSLYPYFEAKAWVGRLPAPFETRGTAVEKMFTRGTIGGKKIDGQQRFEDKPEGRRQLLAWVSRHRGRQMDVEYIVSPRMHRRRVPEYLIQQPDFIENGLAGNSDYPASSNAPGAN